LKFGLLGEKINWKTQIECLTNDESIDFVKGIDVALAGCNFKCSPLAGMLVQGFIKVLRIIMVGMNPICVLKDFVKWRRFVYKLCSLWEWSSCQVPCQKRVFRSIGELVLNFNMCRITFGVFFLSTTSNNKCWMFEKYFRIEALECTW
jgi:hypothetical protein